MVEHFTHAHSLSLSLLQVQEHVLDQRRKEKKEMLSKVKKYNKGKTKGE